MITDSFFHQGTSHEVCEDYALTGPDYAIVCDGCSNGGGPSIDSDWGARFLAKAAEYRLEHLGAGRHMPFYESVLTTTTVACAAVPKLNPECITSTLMVVKKDDEDFLISVMGDGTAGVRMRNGTWIILNWEFLPGGTTESAAPFYLRYLASEEMINSYFKLFGNQFRLTMYRARRLADLTKDPDKLETVGTIRPDGPYFHARFPIEDHDFAFVATDGLASFQQKVVTAGSKTTEAVGLLATLEVMFNELGHRRQGFLRLQRNWAFKRSQKGTFLERGWSNYDDLAIGAISA